MICVTPTDLTFLWKYICKYFKKLIVHGKQIAQITLDHYEKSDRIFTINSSNNYMEYQAVITEAWKLFKDGKKYTFIVLAITFTYTISLFLISALGIATLFGTTTLSNSRVSNSIEATKYVFEDNAIASSSSSSAFGILILVLLCIALFVTIFMWIFNTGVYKAFVEKFKSNKDMSFSEVFKQGLIYFLKIFIAQLLLSLPFIAVFGLLTIVATGLGIGTYSASSDSAAVWGSLSFIVICCGSLLLIPLLILLSMLNMSLQNAILIDGMGILESLSHSLKFVKKYFWKILLLMIIALFVGFVASIPLFCSTFILGFIEGILSMGESAARGGSVSFAGSLVNFVSQLIQSLYLLVLSLYFTCYWIVAYVKLKKLGEEVKPIETSK